VAALPGTGRHSPAIVSNDSSLIDAPTQRNSIAANPFTGANGVLRGDASVAVRTQTQ
jgi:hypothetical protein